MLSGLSRVPPESPQIPQKSALRACKYLCLQREVVTTESAVNRRVVGSSPT